MLIDVLAQHRPCRNVTLRKSYNRAVVETGSGTYAPICLNVQPKPSPGRMAAPNSLRPGLSFRRHLRNIELGVHKQGEFKRPTDQMKLRSAGTARQPSPVDARWLPLVPDNQGRFRVPTLRNVDKRPYPALSKLMGTTDISRLSKPSCISTTRGTSCRAASPMMPVKARPAGRHRSRSTT
jgi:hypothetical protein